MKHHLSDSVLQAWALNQPPSDPEAASHLEQCPQCKETFRNYQLLFSTLKAMEKPSLEMNIEAMVMPQLPTPQPATPAPGQSIIWLAISGIIVFAVPLLMMGNFIRNVFKGVSLIMLAIILVATVTIVVFLFRELINNYNKRNRLLNFYQ